MTDRETPLDAVSLDGLVCLARAGAISRRAFLGRAAVLLGSLAAAEGQWARRVSAQTVTPVAFGQKIRAVFRSASEVQLFSFSAKAGDVATIRVEGVVFFDSFLELLDPTGTVIASNDNFAPGQVASRLENFRLPRTGEYRIRISSRSAVLDQYDLTLEAASPAERPGFPATLSSQVFLSSPAVGDLRGDGKPAIAVGTTDGNVYAVDLDGRVRQGWPQNAGAKLDSSPALGDLDGDGFLEVVIGAGAPAPTNQPGGIFAWRHTGQLLPGFPFRTDDSRAILDGFPDGVRGTPALCDLDNDGALEIVVGAFDSVIYALRQDGRPVVGWPRFIRDTIHSSPACADLDGDGFLEVVIGVDSHREPTLGSQDGGALYVYGHDGVVKAGWPQYVNQVIWSSVALGDLDGDGRLEIVHGSGLFTGYPDPRGFEVNAWRSDGTKMPGWPVPTGGRVFSSPALADLDGDGKLEVLVGCQDGKLYAFTFDGRPVRGWPVTPRTTGGQSLPIGGSPSVANVESEPVTFIPVGFEVVAFGPDGRPRNFRLKTDFSLISTPTIGDFDGDGSLEVTIGSSRETSAGSGVSGPGFLHVWNTGSAAAELPWPMFRQHASRTGLAPARRGNDAAVLAHTISNKLPASSGQSVAVVLKNTGTNPWTPQGNYRLARLDASPVTSAARFSLPAPVAPGQVAVFPIALTTPAAGVQTLQFRMIQDGVELFGRTLSVEVTIGDQPRLYVLDGFGRIFPLGNAPPIPGPNVPWFADRFDIGRDLVLSLDRKGSYVISGLGSVHEGGTARTTSGAGSSPSDVFIAMALAPNDAGYYALQQDGTMSGGDAAPLLAYTTPFSVPPGITAKALRVTRDGKGFFVLAGNGRIFPGGGVPAIAFNTPLFDGDIARDFDFTPAGTGYYILDAAGRVFAGGSAPVLQPAIPPLSGPGAKRIRLTADGRGYYVLDGSGTIYAGGAAPPLAPAGPLFQTDLARGMVLLDEPARAVPPVRVALATNQLEYRGGETPTLLRVIRNVGEARSVDEYAGVLRPDGTLVLLTASGVEAVGTLANINFSRVRPRVASLALPAGAGFTSAPTAIAAFPLTSTLPAGTYTWFTFVTEPGTLTVLGEIATAAVRFTP